MRADLPTAAQLSPLRSEDALTRLEMSHLVERRRDERDRRLVWLHLTLGGRRQADAAVQGFLTAARHVTGLLQAAELAAGLDVAGKLRAGAARLFPRPPSAAEVSP